MLQRIAEAWKVTLPAIFLSALIELLNGAILGAHFEVFVYHYPVLLVALPGLMGLRGNVFGALASRFTTALYLSEMKPSILDRFVFEGITLSMVVTLTPVFVLWAAGCAKVGELAITALLILLTSSILMNLILGFSTAAATVLPFRRNVDPDSVAPPIVTSLADLVTIPVLVAFVILAEVSTKALDTFAILMLSVLALMLAKFRVSRRMIAETFTVVTALAALSAVSGSILESFGEKIYEVLELGVMYPAVLGTLGNYGSVIGAKTSTKLHLGEIESFGEFGKISRDVLGAVTTTPLIALVIMTSAMLAVKVIGREPTFLTAFIALYPLVALLSMFLAFFFAIAAHRIGLDPDNATIPAITTVVDIIATVFVVSLI
ncbi:MAG: magnesium transporter [Archaeoglobaceae archaeon]